MNPPIITPERTQGGLLGWLEQTRVQLPLKGVEVRFDLRADLLDVEIDQIYHQNHRQPLDVIYTFPLPDGAAVHRCEMHVNGRVISAKVRPLAEARKLAEEKKAQGHRTALVESVRENLFELGLGNLAPGDTVVIRLAYVQSLEREGEDQALFRIPLTPGVRYIPGNPLLRRNQGGGSEDDTDVVPDASRLSPPRIDSLHPDAAYLSLEGRVDLNGWDPEKVTSPSHPLLVRPEGDLAAIKLASAAEVPDRDLVVRFTALQKEGVTTAGWITPGADGHTYAMVRLVAPPVPDSSTLTARDYFFLIDRSGSMEGPKWTACAQAVRQFISLMKPLDRAWVTFFETSFQDLAEKPLPAAAILAEPVIAELEQWDVGGGTELFPALTHVMEKLERHSSPQRQPSLIIVTDGQVGDEARIEELLSKWAGKFPVHTFGIDTAVNDAFLKRLAADSGGSCTLATPQNNIVDLVTRVAGRTRTLCAREFLFDGGWEMPGATKPVLWAGDATTLIMRSRSSADSVTVWGDNAHGVAQTWTVPLVKIESSAPRLLWQRKQIESWDRAEEVERANQLACEANLLSKGTAFLAWDDAERVALPGDKQTIYQPSLDKVRSFSFGGMHATGSVSLCMPMPSAAPRPKRSKGLGFPSFRPLTRPSKAEAPESGPRQAPPQDGWREKLARVLKLPESASIQVIDWLEQWVWFDPAKQPARVKLLEDLAKDLAKLDATQGDAKLRAFVTKHVEEPIRSALEALW